MSTITESRVKNIIKSLSTLEDDLDSLHSKVSEMKKNLNIKAQSEVTQLMEKVRDMATKEADVIISKAKEKAELEAKEIAKDGEAKLGEIQAKIDANFDDAVKYVISTILKA